MQTCHSELAKNPSRRVACAAQQREHIGRRPDHSLAGESGTFERRLLGEIRRIGVCLHSIRFGLREQFVDEEVLRYRSYPMAAGRALEPDPDHRVG